MEQTIKPYQYFFIKREVDQLLNAYSSVNDPKTVQTVQALAAEKIRDILEHELPEIDTFLTTVLDVKLTKAQAERALEELKQIVQPFMQPSKPQIEKLFRKVKKLKQPAWNEIDLQEHTYIGWNDPGTQKKGGIFYGKTITESSTHFSVHAEVAGDHSDSRYIHGELICFFLK